MRSLFDSEMTYLVESAEDPTALIARRPGVADGFVWWEDTNRERGHEIAQVDQQGPVVTVVTKKGATYRFEPLTLELYQAQVQAKVELSPAFESTEALQAFYRDAPF